MIHNEADLRTWIDEHPLRHSQRDDDRCSCGWHRPASSWGVEITWKSHYDACLISDLGDVLPSHHATATDSDLRWLSWSEVVADLQQALDKAHGEIDADRD